MLLIVNPYATTVSEPLRELVVYALQGRFEVDAVDTEARGHATELCREAAHEGYDVVVAFGGDGTVNEAANGLLGSPTPLCCLPGGSANVFAKMLGIPAISSTRPSTCSRWPTTGARARSIWGVVNGRCFTFSSGVGLDASVVERVDSNPRLKARLGPYYFAWVAVAPSLRRYLLKPPRMRCRLAGQRRSRASPRSCRTARRSPTSTTARSRSPRAPPGLRRARRLRAAPRHAPGHAADRLARALPPRARRAPPPGDRLSRLTELTVRSADGRPLPLQVDGDYLGEVAEARYSILPVLPERRRLSADARTAPCFLAASLRREPRPGVTR
jgi:diacylglycerol kinase family enzyme